MLGDAISAHQCTPTPPPLPLSGVGGAKFIEADMRRQSRCRKTLGIPNVHAKGLYSTLVRSFTAPLSGALIRCSARCQRFGAARATIHITQIIMHDTCTWKLMPTTSQRRWKSPATNLNDPLFGSPPLVHVSRYLVTSLALCFGLQVMPHLLYAPPPPPPPPAPGCLCCQRALPHWPAKRGTHLRTPPHHPVRNEDR